MINQLVVIKNIQAFFLHHGYSSFLTLQTKYPPIDRKDYLGHNSASYDYCDDNCPLRVNFIFPSHKLLSFVSNEISPLATDLMHLTTAIARCITQRFFIQFFDSLPKRPFSQRKKLLILFQLQHHFEVPTVEMTTNENHLVFDNFTLTIPYAYVSFGNSPKLQRLSSMTPCLQPTFAEEKGCSVLSAVEMLEFLQYSQMHRTSKQSSLLKKYILNAIKPKKGKQQQGKAMTACQNVLLSLSSCEIPGEEEEHCPILKRMRKYTKRPKIAATKDLSFQVQACQDSTTYESHKLTQIPCNIQHDFKKHHQRNPKITDQISTAKQTIASTVSLEQVLSLYNSQLSEKEEQPVELNSSCHQSLKENEIQFIFTEIQKIFYPEPSTKINRSTFIPYKRKNFNEEYELKGRIGGGTFGTAYKCIHLPSNTVRTVKILKKNNLLNNKEIIRRQIQILRKLDHPQVIKMYQAFEYDHTLHIVLEYCSGGTLKEYCKKDISSEVKRQILKQLLTGMNYIHQMGIIHRDIKPENVLLLNSIDSHSKPSDVCIKIIDFGLSTPFTEKYFKDWKKIGSLMYLAPEAFSGIYSTKCDMWGCGIVAHMLLLGFNPYIEEDAQQTLVRIQSYQIQSAQCWSSLSKEEHKLLHSLLSINYFLRQQASFCLKLPYFQFHDGIFALTDRQKSKMFKKVSSFKRNHCNFLDLLHYYLSFTKTEGKLQHKLSRIFNCIDADNDGLISYQQLHQFFAEADQQQMHRIFKEIDFNGSGRIDYGQFVCAMADKKDLYSLENIRQLFQLIDINSHKSLHLNEIKTFMIRFGYNSNREAELIFEEMDSNHNGKVSCQQFTWFMLRKIYFAYE